MVPKTLYQLSRKDLDRFWSKVDKKPDNTVCWEWKDKLNDGGYGDFSLSDNGKSSSFRAHRVSLFLATNQQDLVARHTCDNRACCNPHHLLWGDHQDNSDDKMSRNRGGHAWGSGHGMAKLKEYQVKRIREAYKDRLSPEFIAKRFNICVRHVYRIVNYENWRYLKD